ncbi:MAG: TetR/AcrR family transcriptional regulator [Marmoricola sp.]
MRKIPRQERSRQMVERIIEAGREVLVRDGYQSFTTNRVADAAGVSPGSLYQYFPDKAAIIDEIVERYLDEVSERVAGTLAHADAVDLTADPMGAARAVTRALLAALEKDAPLLRIVVGEMPAGRIRERRAALEQRIVDVLTTYLVVALGMATRDASARAWLLVMTVEAVSSRWVLEHPAALDRDRLVDELTALAAGYLLR